MNAADHHVGAGAQSPLQVPARGWLAILRRTWAEMNDDNIGIIAAGIAFYVFAAIVPTLAAVVLSYGLFADAETVQRNVEAVFASLPRDAAAIIADQLLTVVDSSQDKQGLGLAVAIALAWYGATKGSSAIITGLNVAYDAKETRGFIHLNLLQLAVVAGGVLMIFMAIGTTVLLAFLNGLIPNAPWIILAIIRLGGYLLLALLVVTAAAVLFRFGPDHREPRWRWLSPGSIGATLLWLAGTAGFGFYVASFGNYGATYGSLSAVIVTLTWLWLTAYVFLLGAELNAELERQVKDTSVSSAVSEAGSADPNQNVSHLPAAIGRISKPILQPANLLVSLCSNGVIVTVGFGLLRRGRFVGVVPVAVAALLAWKSHVKRVGSKNANARPPSPS